MQIILKENPDLEDRLCLFDTRSDSFIPGGGISIATDTGLLDIANSVVRRSAKSIYDIILTREYGDLGYTELMIAEQYLKLNPDIKKLALDKLAEKPGRKSKKFKDENPDDKPITSPSGKKRGRPRKDTQSEANVVKEKTPITVSKSGKILSNFDSAGNPIKRGRGRPRKDSYIMTV